MPLEVRRVRAEDWPRCKELRLEALKDPVASIAFLETYAEAVERPDSFWQERTARAAGSGDAQVAQFVAVDGDTDEWVASVVGLREDAGTEDWSGRTVEERQVHVVGVWVRPDRRGAGVLGRLVSAVDAWARQSGVERMRLLVHEDNARAAAAYRKLGFRPTGLVVPVEAGNEIEMRLSRG